MAQPAVTLKPNSPLGGPTEPHPQSPAGPRCEAMKFSYATGARPLDGFTIKRGVGVGGFGEVYYAVSDAGKEVALKRIQRHLDIELRGVGQCLNLKHPNLVSLYDIKYDDQGEAWVVMEYVVGESLRDALDRCPEGLPAAEAQHWFLGMAAGVAYLHDRGIVHRDLKPGNLFSDEGVVKIGDYGLSKFISCSRRSGQTESVGTFHYMAPEIGRGSYGKQIDIYALGVILYELLTGRVPFEGESTQEIIMKHLTADPDLSIAPAPFREVIRRALMKDPEKRYRNVGEMVEAVQGAFGAAGRSRGAGPDIVDAYVVEGPRHHAAGAQAARAAAAHAPLPPSSPSPFSPSPSSPPASPVDDEPIAAALRGGIDQALAWINDPNTNNWTRALVIGAAVVMLYWNAAWLIPMAVVLGVVYLIYFAVRAAVLGVSSKPSAPHVPHPNGSRPPAPPAQVQAVAMPAAPLHAAYAAQEVRHAAPVMASLDKQPTEKSKRRVRTSEAVRALLAQRPRLEQARDLTGSLLVAPLVAAILTAVSLMLGDRSNDYSISTATTFAWMWGTTVVGAWTLLSLGKSWSHTNGDDVWRRFAMLIAGMGVGLAAWGLGLYLNVSLAPASPAAVRLPGIGAQLYNSATSQPQLAAYLLFFGFQFLALRWWKQADPLRYTRLNLWDAGVCVLAALIVSRFVPFWSPWGLLIPAAISLTVQLSAPWINQPERTRLRELVGGGV
ncbi:MAG: protein kinase [Pirellulales bacterium]